MNKTLIYGANSSVAQAFVDHFPKQNYILCSRETLPAINISHQHIKVDYHHPNFNSVDWSQVRNILYCVGITNGSFTQLDTINHKLLNIFLDNIPSDIPIHFISSIATVSNTSDYATSKKSAEKVLLKRMPHANIYRPSVLVGKWEKNNFPIIKKMLNFSPIILKLTPSPVLYPINIKALTSIIYNCMQKKSSGRRFNLSGQKAHHLNDLMEMYLNKKRKKYLSFTISIAHLKQIASILKKIPFFPDKLFLLQQILSYHPHDPIKCDQEYIDLLSQELDVFDFNNPNP